MTVYHRYTIDKSMKISYITVTKKILNVSRGTVHNWASSKKRPSVEHAQKLESLYGFPMSCFLTSDREKVWPIIKTIPESVLKKKLVSFFNKQNINSHKQKATVNSHENHHTI